MIRGVNILVWKHLLLLYYRHFLFNVVGPASSDDEAEDNWEACLRLFRGPMHHYGGRWGLFSQGVFA